MKFEYGDTVYLKSGGPAMTVVPSNNPDASYVGCTWFANGQLYTQSIFMLALTKKAGKLRH